MSTLITVLIVFASVLLILAVLVQKSKGGGLSSNFASSNAVMGVRKTTDFIEKATWGLASFIIVMSILAVVVRPKAAVEDIIPQAPVTAPLTPDMGTNSALPLDLGTPAEGTATEEAQPAE